MKSGHIEQFAHLSNFSSVKEFNQSIAIALDLHGYRFTKGERMAFEKLVQYSVKKLGVCNARICKLVQATQQQSGGISRSTFERMIRKAKKLGILTIHRTLRETGGYSHNVYVFNRFDKPNSEQLTKRPSAKNPDETSPKHDKKNTEATLFKTTQNQNHRIKTLDSLDATFTPGYVPQPFVKAVKPFFNCAQEISHLWGRAAIAYHAKKFDSPIESFLPTIIQAFKETIYRYKQKQIQKSFTQYFYGTVAKMLSLIKQESLAKEQPFMQWLMN
ncbi:hypothetical protein [Halalkalibacter nanhaiisediminis]|uniref:Uncharacterized protein n=1 Tax=Halalkalibacter nanhaiisediminis TaxID=688079 RepID=A0A562QUV6_9BACI|nr:hypothetical protein [Halalkalibacter nanhaiisediminis]TWI59916.1 hypothetical protein IQ10_00339 [Halalkalibacter nanhaiisediminis]